MMKQIIIFFFFVLMGITIHAQDADLPKRNISLVIQDKKGRPLERILVRSLSNVQAGMTDRKGLFVFTDMSDNDKISVSLPKYGETTIPVTGMDSIVITLRSARSYSYMNNEGLSVMIDRRNRTDASSLIDAQALMEQHPYQNLIDLLQGANVAGLNITSSSRTGEEATVNIRGERSLNFSNEPLVVMDGMPVGGLGMANNIVNVNDVKTIEVQKGDSSEWGVRGANGVILIKTK